jgi:hypothetical protein
MMLDDLIGKLTDLRDEIESNLGETGVAATDVRLAIQPGYPMQHLIADTDPVWVVDDEAGEVVVYLADAGQPSDAPYLPGQVSELLGWR